MIYQRLAKEYGFTPETVNNLTPYQTLMYLNDTKGNDAASNLDEDELKGFQSRLKAGNEELAERILERMTDD